MRERALIELGEKYGLQPERLEDGIALRGTLRGVELRVSQYAMPMGPDPRPRPFTELWMAHGGQALGGLFGASPDAPGDTGDADFDLRFCWQSLPDPDGPAPGYLRSPEIRAGILALDRDIASAVGHAGAQILQIDSLRGAVRMTILTHLPEALLLERAIDLLSSICAE